MQKLFTYSVNEAELEFIQVGMRVAVPFGKSKIFTAIVFEKHHEKPEAYEAKDIYQILDDQPVVTQLQLRHWQWISDYYMCSLGDVMRASIPRAFLLESETLVLKNEAFDQESLLNDEEFLIWEALEHQAQLKIDEIGKILDRKGVLSVVKEMINKEAISVKEEIYEQYKPKMVRYIQLHNNYKTDDKLHKLLDELSRAPKQREVMLSFFNLRLGSEKPIEVKELIKKSNVSSAIVNSLIPITDSSIFSLGDSHKFVGDE